MDLFHISIDAQTHTLAQLVYSKSTDKLFADDITVDPQGDREAAPHEDQAKSVGDEACPLEGNQMVEGKNGENPVD